MHFFHGRSKMFIVWGILIPQKTVQGLPKPSATETQTGFQAIAFGIKIFFVLHEVSSMKSLLSAMENPVLYGFDLTVRPFGNKHNYLTVMLWADDMNS